MTDAKTNQRRARNPESRVIDRGGNDVSLPRHEHPDIEDRDAVFKILHESVLIKNELNEKAKCPHLWPESVTKRPRKPPKRNKAKIRSGIILKRIISALRQKGLLNVIAPSIVTPLTIDDLVVLFGQRVPRLERQLGRLMLDAIVRGDRRFTVDVADAMKDSDHLFHRGTSPCSSAIELFHRWWSAISSEDRTLSRLQIRDKFASEIREVSGQEWNAITKYFLSDIPRPRSRVQPKKN